MILTRVETSDEGTFGVLESEALCMQTGELPWRNNERNVSCIPTGTYLAKAHYSPRFGKCFWLQDVPERSEILIHPANWMGNVDKGFKSNLAGCIAIGMTLKRDVGAHDQDMIQQSKLAIDKLIEYTDFRDFTIQIVNETDVSMDVDNEQ